MGWSPRRRYQKIRLGTIHEAVIVCRNQRVATKNPMLTQLPQITVNGDCRLGDLWQMIIRIDLGRNVQSIDEEIDLRNLEANCFQIKIELQFRENLELLAKHPLISS
jgi:hypothetical protein